MNEFVSLASCNSRNSPANKAKSAFLAWPWLHGCAWKPFMRFEWIFSEWILDSFVSGILDSKSWILDFHAQYYLTWGEINNLYWELWKLCRPFINLTEWRQRRVTYQQLIAYINTREKIRYFFTFVVMASLGAGNPCITPSLCDKMC